MLAIVGWIVIARRRNCVWVERFIKHCDFIGQLVRLFAIQMSQLDAAQAIGHVAPMRIVAILLRSTVTK